jgi:superfamily II DNA or RNA helicase
MSDERLGAQQVLSEKERLQLHQLRTLEWLSARDESKQKAAKGGFEAPQAALPDRWELTRGVNLFDWQQDCVNRWFSAGERGTVKVVTGAGKTLLGLAIAERLQRERDPELRVAVIVPTIVLMNQWYEEIISRSNLPPSALGRLGGGYEQDFAQGRRILISVLATAHKSLPKLVDSAGLGKHLFLIADECHRVGAAEMSKVLSTPRAFSLGLSATPERVEDEDSENSESDNYDETLLGKELGGLIYELTLAEAVRLGVIPTFTIRHYGLPLTLAEQSQYDRLSREITDTRTELQNIAPRDRSAGAAFFSWARSTSTKNKGQIGELARRFVADTGRRKELLYKIEARSKAVEELLRAEFANNTDARAILFHESIAEVMRHFLRLRDAGLPVIAEHSELPPSVREEGLELFRKGIAQVIVSVRSLIEGFNVPAADIGIIVASSTSVRQRIQSLGRVLRRHRGPEGEEKTSMIHILYARNTVDDAIYEKVDWEEITGAERNQFFRWDPDSGAVLQPGPPRAPLPRDSELDPSTLSPGAVYPGRYEGEEFSCDTRGNILDAKGRYATNPSNVSATIQSIKGSAGRFRVTPTCRYVLVRIPEGEEWVTRFIGRLEDPLIFEAEQDGAAIETLNYKDWAAKASPGDLYPFASVPVKITLKYRQRQGGVISKRIPGGEVYARVGMSSKDAQRGEDAARLLTTIKALHEKGEPVNQFEVNEYNHAVYHTVGTVRFITSLDHELEFPETGAAEHGERDA